MLMRKCDRCGTFYEDNTYSPAIVYGTFNRHGMPRNTKELRFFDVCDDCVESFIKWMTNEENTDEALKIL